MYCYGLKFAIWWGDKSVVWNWFLATKDIEHESNAFKAKHVISYKPLASSKSPYFGAKELPVGGYLNLELCRFLLAIDDWPIQGRGLQPSAFGGVDIDEFDSHILIQLQPFSHISLRSWR